MAVKDTVDSAIADNTITIFSKSYCPFCKRAKQLLKTEFPDAQTQIIELDETSEGDTIQEYLAEKVGKGRVTVPQIWLNQKHVGGCDDVHALHAQGKLKELVAAPVDPTQVDSVEVVA